MTKIELKKNFLLNLDFTVPPEIPDDFYTIFAYLRKRFQIPKTRKCTIHNLLKKAKAKFFKMVNQIINSCLNSKVKKLPQSFIININIDKNLKYMNKTILQIYQKFNLLPDYQTLLEQNKIKKEMQNLFEKFCSFSLQTLYQEYLESKRYVNDLIESKNCEGKRIQILYEFVSKNFILYFMYYGKKSFKNNNINNNDDKDKDKNLEILINENINSIINN